MWELRMCLGTCVRHITTLRHRWVFARATVQTYIESHFLAQTAGSISHAFPVISGTYTGICQGQGRSWDHGWDYDCNNYMDGMSGASLRKAIWQWCKTSWKSCENVVKIYICTISFSRLIHQTSWKRFMKICRERPMISPWKCCESFRLLNLSWKYVGRKYMSWNCRETVVKIYLAPWWKCHEILFIFHDVVKIAWWKSRENVVKTYICTISFSRLFSSDVVKMCYENVLKKLWKCC